MTGITAKRFPSVAISMEPGYGWRRSGTPNGPTVERVVTAAKPEHAGGALTPQHDLYLAVIVAGMFLAGCVLVILSRRERSQERKRWKG